MSYQVTAPLVIVPDETGAQRYFYQGAVLPDGGLDKKRVEELAEEGMLEKVSADSGDGPPAKSANKGDWEGYARSQGASDEDLEGLTKDELVEKYGS